MTTTDLALRSEPTARDEAAVAELVRATGFFSPDEVAVAAELVRERLAKGIPSGYHFLFADTRTGLAGFACFGPIACTRSSFALYWIAVHPARQGQGLGRKLLYETRRAIRHMHGTRLYAETSAKAQYAPTRAFYEISGFTLDCLQHNFYAPHDHKATYLLVL